MKTQNFNAGAKSKSNPTATFVRFSEEVETLLPDEEKIGDEVLASMMRQMRKMSDQLRHAHRGTHSKSHAYLKGRLEVYEELEPELAQGLFAKAKSFPIIVRLASLLGEIAPDSVKTQRGFSWKVIGVEGEKLSGHEGEMTQDFLMDNGMTFPVADIRGFLAFQKLQEETVGKAHPLKAALSTVQAGLSDALKSVGVESAKVDFMGHSQVHILADSYGSQGAIRYGDHVAKLRVTPLSDNLLDLKDYKHDLSRGFSPLMEDIRDFFKTQTAIFEVAVQLCANLETMPIEDLTVEWSAEESPYRPVGRIIIEPQESYSDERRVFGDDLLSYSPGHSLEAHRPLGSIMRARLKVYPKAVEFRTKYNAVTKREPRSITELPD